MMADGAAVTAIDNNIGTAISNPIAITNLMVMPSQSMRRHPCIIHHSHRPVSVYFYHSIFVNYYHRSGSWLVANILQSI
ncbi:MAG: hypothetical protein WC782_07185 [Methylococcaceae bacterium]|jgi:hypothetical protein